jgi:NAD(P)-dependent dehydrogenase (short-subunit alcohol dehydrogenase family)
MDLGLKDQVVFITGASRGIGRATAELLVEEGSNVAITGRDEDTLRRAVEELGGDPFQLWRIAPGGRLDPFPHDLGRVAARAELARAGARRHDHEIEAIEECPRELVPVGSKPLGGARALRGGIAPGAARAQVHRRDEQDSRREDALTLDAAHRQVPVLERLPERLERRALELPELVE